MTVQADCKEDLKTFNKLSKYRDLQTDNSKNIKESIIVVVIVGALCLIVKCTDRQIDGGSMEVDPLKRCIDVISTAHILLTDVSM